MDSPGKKIGVDDPDRPPVQFDVCLLVNAALAGAVRAGND
jgi:hypothetical protein